MKKVLGAAVLAFVLAGCGGPLEDDRKDATGAAQQGLEATNTPKTPAGGPQLNRELVRSAQERVVGAPAFQERMHLTDPIRK